MKTTGLLTLLLLFMASCQQNGQAARIESLFDDDWKFQSGDVQGVEIPIKEASFFVAYFFLDV